MKTTILFPTLAFLTLFILPQVGCTPKPGPNVPDTSFDGGISQDASVSEDSGGDAAVDLDSAKLDDCAKACTNVQALHCATGTTSSDEETCATSCRHARDTKLMPLDIACAIRAKTSADLHLCKGWGC